MSSNPRSFHVLTTLFSDNSSLSNVGGGLGVLGILVGAKKVYRTRYCPHAKEHSAGADGTSATMPKHKTVHRCRTTAAFCTVYA